MSGVLSVNKPVHQGLDTYLEISIHIGLNPFFDLVSINTFEVRNKLLHVLFEIDDPGSGRVTLLNIEETGDTLRILITSVNVNKQYLKLFKGNINKTCKWFASG